MHYLIYVLLYNHCNECFNYIIYTKNIKLFNRPSIYINKEGHKKKGERDIL